MAIIFFDELNFAFIFSGFERFKIIKINLKKIFIWFYENKKKIKILICIDFY